MFRGYQRIKLNKAHWATRTLRRSATTMSHYSVDVLGRKTDKVVKLSTIERDFGKLRMTALPTDALS